MKEGPVEAATVRTRVPALASAIGEDRPLIVDVTGTSPRCCPKDQAWAGGHTKYCNIQARGPKGAASID